MRNVKVIEQILTNQTGGQAPYARHSAVLSIVSKSRNYYAFNIKAFETFYLWNSTVIE